MAGRPRMPVERKKANGSFNVTRDKDRNEIALRAGESITAPEKLSEDAKEFFRLIYNQANEWGVFADTDVTALTLASEHYDNYKKCLRHADKLEFSKGKTLRYEAMQWSDRCVKILKDMGFTPSDRQRVLPRKDDSGGDWFEEDS